MFVTKESHEVVTAVNLTLSVDEAKELSALLYAVAVNYSTDTFDSIAANIDDELGGTVEVFVKDENGEFGPEEHESGGCGCGAAVASIFSDDEAAETGY